MTYIRYLEIYDSFDSNRLLEVKFELSNRPYNNVKIFKRTLGGMYRTYYIKATPSNYVKQRGEKT